MVGLLRLILLRSRAALKRVWVTRLLGCTLLVRWLLGWLVCACLVVRLF